MNPTELYKALQNSVHFDSFLDTAHSAWEDVADQYAAIISAWVMGGYRNTGA